MVEQKKFSYSDISKVMNKAASLTATTSLQSPFYNASLLDPASDVGIALDLENESGQVMLGSIDKESDLTNFYLSQYNKPKNKAITNKIILDYYRCLSNLLHPYDLFSRQTPNPATQPATRTANKLHKTELLEFLKRYYIQDFPEKLLIVKGGKNYYNSKLLIDLNDDLGFENPNIKNLFVYRDIGEYIKYLEDSQSHMSEPLIKTLNTTDRKVDYNNQKLVDVIVEKIPTI